MVPLHTRYCDCFSAYSTCVLVRSPRVFQYAPGCVGGGWERSFKSPICPPLCWLSHSRMIRQSVWHMLPWTFNGHQGPGDDARRTTEIGRLTYTVQFIFAKLVVNALVIKNQLNKLAQKPPLEVHLIIDHRMLCMLFNDILLILTTTNYFKVTYQLFKYTVCTWPKLQFYKIL